MNTPHIKPARKADHKKENDAKRDSGETGLDEWNARLEHNLEPEEGGDTEADQKATDYSDKEGSGDQSDDK